MYLLGKITDHSTFTCKQTFPQAQAKLRENTLRWPGAMMFLIHIPNISRAWVVGVKSKPDTLCAFTTEEEAKDQHTKYLKYYPPSALYLISFGDEKNDT